MSNSNPMIEPLSFDSYLEARTVLRKRFEEDLAEYIVFCEDNGAWALSEDVHQCDWCKNNFFWRSSLNEDFYCECCEDEREEEQKHRGEIASDYYASR